MNNRLLCIELPKTVDKNAGAMPIIKVGDVYHLNQDCYGDGMFYELVEHIGYAYASRCFIPCSDIDETTFERYKKPEWQFIAKGKDTSGVEYNLYIQK